MVHRRTLDGEDIILGNQGDLFKNAMTWWDHGTGSIWTQPRGEAIAGPLAGKTLARAPSELTSWGEWRSAHPDTLALDAPGRSSGFDLDRMVIAVDFGDESVAYPVPELREVGVVNDVVAEVPMAVVLSGSSWRVFSRQLDEAVVSLEHRGDVLVDERSGSTFDPVTGRGLEGPHQGQILVQLPGFTSFPFEYRSHWPEGRIRSP